MEDWKTEALKLHREKYDMHTIARAVRKRYSTVTQFLKGVKKAEFDALYNGGSEFYKKYVGIQPEKKRVVGVIGDTHFPFVAKGYLDFLIDTFKKYEVDEIIHIGDMCDNNAISRFANDPSGMSPTEEYEKALKCVQEYAKEFPKLKYTVGNHSLILERQAATLGIPKGFVKDIRTLWKFPDGWEVGERFLIDKVLYEHGLGWGGKTGAIDKAVNSMMSCVIGHSHAFGGCLYKSNSEQLIFGLNAGCGIDIDRYAFKYSQYDKNRAILGCGIVLDSSYAIFEPMGEKYFHR